MNSYEFILIHTNSVTIWIGLWNEHANYEKVWIEKMKLWKSMNQNYELDYELMYEMTMKWLWNDYEMTKNSFVIFDMKWTMKQPMK